MYQVTLLQNMDNRPPSALEVVYTFTANTQVWPVTALGRTQDTAVVIVDCAKNLIQQPGVISRVLRAHYPTTPTVRDYTISSVQPPMTKETTMTDYKTTINMSADTVDKLTRGNYSLYGFKAVKTTAVGSPLVWFATKTFSLNTEVIWQEMYEAYTSRTELKPNTKINATASYAIDLHQTLNVTSSAGTGTVDTQTGTESAISIFNDTQTPFTCGISQIDPNGNITPMCAFNLYGGGLDVIEPVEQVLFMFATDTIKTGTVIEKAFSPGLMVDVTGAQPRVVEYDINAGWTWGGEPWGVQVKASDNLLPLLVQNSPALSKLRLLALHAA